MNIKFIGTGTMGSTTRANTSILVDNILFDCGMGTIKQLERLGNKVKDLDYVVISHFHADHFFDLPNLIIGKKIRNELDKKIYIVGPIGIRQKTYDMMIFAFGDLGSLEDYANIEFLEIAPNEPTKLNDYILTAYELIHGKEIPNYGYLLEKDNKCVGYTGDSTICDNFYTMCEKANYMIVDTCMPNKSNPAHIGLNDLINNIDAYNNCKFYSVHRGDYEIPNTDKVKFPNDGDILDI
jgi:ribonuclease BN (tRNA processing enzyme)